VQRKQGKHLCTKLHQIEIQIPSELGVTGKLTDKSWDVGLCSPGKSIPNCK